jgi:flagellar biosynthesis chaperone FliJ
VTTPAYPLEELATIKQKKCDEAERVLNEKKELLAKEVEKLRAAEAARDEVKLHREEKLAQLRKGMDEGIAPYKITQMKSYLKVVDEKLHQKEMKVIERQKEVTKAEQQVEIARLDLIRRQKEVEKLKEHRKEWEREVAALFERKEGVEMDEIGSVLHERRRRLEQEMKE